MKAGVTKCCNADCTPEAEAKNALRLTERLLHWFNLDKAMGDAALRPAQLPGQSDASLNPYQ
ncbi:hypothetical protein T492DRAFT_869494 [Pavlovales sp. CCMP2436]|nr:hypothetical protein T492DRAFT_869494 [Pavlovales sp. CCMP2436]